MDRTVIAVTLGLLVLGSAASAQPMSGVEDMILDAMPRPVRCDRTLEPFFFCKHDTSGQHLALEIGATNDGLSTSLTYNYDNPAAPKYLAVVRRFFRAIGIADKAIDACVYDPQWQPDGASTSQFKLRCRRVEFTGRVTHEFFALYPSNADLSDALIRYAKLDYAAALSMLLPLGQKGDPVAQEVIGFMYMRGEGVPADRMTAFHWLRLAAEAGRPDAQLALGRFYQAGLAISPDAKQALSWFSRAAARGSPDAMNAAGELCLLPNGVGIDYPAALSWFRQGAAYGSVESMLHLGSLYLAGTGVDRDEIEAFKWFDLAFSETFDGPHEQAGQARAQLAERLTPMQISAALTGVERWRQHSRHDRQ